MLNGASFFLAMLLIGAIYGHDHVLHSINPDVGGHHFLLTFPRSGTNLTCCYIQAATGKPIWFLNQATSDLLSNNRLQLRLDPSKSPLFREHIFEMLNGLNKKGNKLLFVLRNYKECIHRRVKSFNTNNEFKNLFINRDPVVEQYIGNLSTYDQWDPAHRLLIYYKS